MIIVKFNLFFYPALFKIFVFCNFLFQIQPHFKRSYHQCRILKKSELNFIAGGFPHGEYGMFEPEMEQK